MRKKKIVGIAGVFAAAVLFAGCAGQESGREYVESGQEITEETETTETDQIPEDNAPEDQTTGQEMSGTPLQEEVEAAQDRLVESRIVQEHSFDVELNGWGAVRFVTYAPDSSQGADPGEDVSFYLLRDKEFCINFRILARSTRADMDYTMIWHLSCLWIRTETGEKMSLSGYNM